MELDFQVRGQCKLRLLKQFTGLEHDTNAEGGLEHTLFRKYSATQGRWLSPDPYMGSMDIGNPQSLNRYAYVGNDPVNWIDQNGLERWYSIGDCVYHSTSTSNWNGNTMYVDVVTETVFCASGGGNNLHTVTGDESGRDAGGFTLGIRVPNQSFGQCMEQNGNMYSIGGSIELGANVATGTNTSYSSNRYVSAITGNSINALAFGDRISRTARSKAACLESTAGAG